jgi:hypothetical protein
MNKAAAIFSILCGIAMMIVWAVLLSTGQVPELKTTPLEAGFLLGAEYLTAVSLILGGFGILARRIWRLMADQAALGMLLYCAVYSIGVFGQAGNIPAAAFFILVVALAAVFSGKFVLDSMKGEIQ